MANKAAVAVSGITGYIGAEVAAALLKRGYTVHGTVRHNTPEKTAHLTSLTVPGELKVFEADLNVFGSFDEAVKGCTYAIHVASPYLLDVKDPQKEIIDPALNGTLSFLESCQKEGVGKVVITSSVSAIADGGANGKVVDESVWNERSTASRLPYYYAKTTAEKAAWKFVEEEAPGMKLVAINPEFVLGPSLIDKVNESVNVVVGTAKGEFGGILDLDLAIVDVRDVAEAHVRAMESETAEGRYICSSDRLMSHREIVEVVNAEGLRPATRDLTGKTASMLIKLFSYFMSGDTGQFVRNYLGNPIIPTNAKIKRDLGMEFIDPAETVRQTCQDLIKRGHLTKAEA